MEIRISCPYCSDTKGRFYYNTFKKMFFCFNCNKKGFHKNLKSSILNSLKSGQKVFTGNKTRAKEKLVNLPFIPITKHTPGAIKEYVLKRVSWQEIAKYRLSYLPDYYKRYKGRFVLPVTNKRGEIIYFQARTYWNSKVKYLNPKVEHCSLSKSQVIWNLQRIPDKHKKVVITEGIFSGIAIPEEYIGCCIFGKYCSRRQIELLRSKLLSQVYICLDPDAKQNQYNLAFQLETFNIKCFLVNLRADPADTNKKVLLHLLRIARSFDDYILGETLWGNSSFKS